MTRSSRQAGYSLLELLIVTVVLAAIVSIALASIWNCLDRAKQRATMADMRTVARAIEVYHSEFGYLPIAPGGIAQLKSVLVPYQSTVLPTRDHWGHDLAYRFDRTAGTYTLESFGKDGVDGADISISTKLLFNADIVFSNGQFSASPE